MESCSSVRVISKFVSTFQENKESFNMRRKLSPTIDLSQYSGLLTLNKKVSSSLNLKVLKPKTSFYEEISEICKKLDPDFKIEHEGANCYNLIKETIKKAVDLILKNDKMDTRGKIAKLKAKCKEIQNLNKSLQKDLQNWQEREIFLEKQETKIKEIENRLQAEQKLFINEKNFVNSTKKYYFQLENEIKDLRFKIKEQEKNKYFDDKNFKDFESKVLSIHSEALEMMEKNKLELKKIEDLRHFIQVDKEELEMQKSQFLSLCKNYSSQDLQEYLQKETEKLENDRKILENETKVLKKWKKELEMQAEQLKKQKEDQETDKKLINDIQKNLSEIEFQLLEREKSVKAKEESLSDRTLNKKPSDLANLTNEEVELVLLDLQQQLEVVNKELGLKEDRLQNWEATLQSKEKLLEEKQAELETIEKKLRRSKLESSLSNPDPVKSSETEKIFQTLSLKNQELDKKIKENIEKFELLSIVKTEVEEIFDKTIKERETLIENQLIQVTKRKKEVSGFMIITKVDKCKRENAAEELRKERIRLEHEQMVKAKDLSFFPKLEKYVKSLGSLIELLMQKEEEVIRTF